MTGSSSTTSHNTASTYFNPSARTAATTISYQRPVMARAGDQSGKKTGGKKSFTGNRGPVSHTTPLWPCKINGCGKQFVREADLRRHQRTTKVHANPNYVCGECGASFTRTDALKRHEKSKNHVVQVPSRNSSAFVEDGSTTASTGTKTTTSTSPELSTRSKGSRSLSPGPSREKEKEYRERERKLGDRELPPLPVPVPSGYYRPNTVATIPYESSAPPNSWPTASFSRLQTHSPSLNAILASPISTPRLHPADWSLPSSGQKRTVVHNDNGCAQTSSLPASSPPPFNPSNRHDAPHYRYPRSPPCMVSRLPISENPAPTSRELLSYDHKDHTPRGRLDTCHTTLTSRVDSDSNGNEGAASVTSIIRRGEGISLTPSLSSASPVHLAVPPIAASTGPVLTSDMLADDDGSGDDVSNSSDSDGTEESDEEVDELESTDSETELVKSEDKTGPNPADVRPKHLAPIKSVTVEETGNEALITSIGHSIPEIDIEACIDPVATGITKEEVKAAMDDMRKQEQAEQQEQQQRLQGNNDHDGGLGTLGMGIGINICANSTGVDHGGLPFLNEMVLSSPSPALTVNDAGIVHGVVGQMRHDHPGDNSSIDTPYVHQNPGSRRGPQSRDSDECHSPSSFLGDPRGNLDTDFYHHRLSRRHRSYESHDENEEAESRLGGSEDLDIKMVYSADVDVDAGGDVDIGEKLLEKAVNERVRMNAMDVDGINDSPESSSWHGHNRRHLHDAYGSGGGGGQYSSPSLDWSPSFFLLEQHHRHSHSRRYSFFDEDEEDEEHMLHHRHTCHQLHLSQ